MAGRKLKIEWSQDVYDLMKDCVDIDEILNEELIKLASKEINQERLKMEEQNEN